MSTPAVLAASFPGGSVLLIVIALFIIFTVTLAILSRLKKCPSDKVMVIFGSVWFRGGTGQHAARCLHGGTAFIWPVIQDYGFLSLRPIQLEVNLRNALCKQNIRINVPSVFTVGISTDEALMGNAANRLLGLTPDAIGELAKDIIFGQLRLVIASMTIEEINSDRETFLRSIEQNLAEELNKIGLLLLNVNITDITDESGYIDALGKRAASEAINKARIEVAEEERKGGIGEAEARKAQRIAVSQAEALAQAGEADADKQRRISIKQAEAEAMIGEAEADKQRRISTKQAEAEAIHGENLSAIEIAQSNAARIEKEADAYRQAEAAKRIAEAKIKQADFEAEQVAQTARAKMEMEKQKADTIVRAEIEKQQIEIQAEAEAEKLRREAKGQADAIYAKLEAEARGNFAILKAKGEGYQQIITACGNDSDAASKMLLIEKLEELVRLQTEAIRNIKIDKVTVWDGGKAPDGKNATANFLSGMMQSLPPLHDVAGMAGVDLPAYLGKVKEGKDAAPQAPAK